MPDVLNLSLGCPRDALANLELLFPIPGTKTRKESMGEGERVSIVGLKKSRKLLTCLCVSQGRRKGQEQHENCSYLAHFFLCLLLDADKLIYPITKFEEEFNRQISCLEVNIVSLESHQITKKGLFTQQG